jgi:hypothetical protein
MEGVLLRRQKSVDWNAIPGAPKPPRVHQKMLFSRLAMPIHCPIGGGGVQGKVSNIDFSRQLLSPENQLKLVFPEETKRDDVEHCSDLRTAADIDATSPPKNRSHIARWPVELSCVLIGPALAVTADAFARAGSSNL